MNVTEHKLDSLTVYLILKSIMYKAFFEDWQSKSIANDPLLFKFGFVKV